MSSFHRSPYIDYIICVPILALHHLALIPYSVWFILFYLLYLLIWFYSHNSFTTLQYWSPSEAALCGSHEYGICIHPYMILAMGTFHWPFLSLCARWRHQFPVQECVQRLTLSSIAQESANKTKTTNKIHNSNECSTSSDLILLIRTMFCYWEVFVATPCLTYH